MILKTYKTMNHNMKPSFLGIAAAITLFTACQNQTPDFHGAWYSVNHHAVMSIELGADSVC